MPAPTPRSWYSFKNAAASRIADVYIFDSIGGWGDDLWGEALTSKSFIDDLAKLPSDTHTIRLHVNSPGGDVFSALAIANALRDQRTSKKRTVDVFIEGLAASSASIVVMAGNSIRIADNALMMIHNPWTFAVGDAKNMRDVADRLDKVRQTIIATYRWQTKQSPDQISGLMDATTWMDADEAIANGFATVKTQGLKAAASFDRHAVSKLAVPNKYRSQLHSILNSTSIRPAASGTGRSTSSSTSGATDSQTDSPMNVSEQITTERETLRTKSTRLEELMADDGPELTPDEEKERNAISAEITKLTSRISNLVALEAAQAAQAVPVFTPPSPVQNQTSRPVRMESSNRREPLPKGTIFTRYFMAVAAGKGSHSDTLAYAKRWQRDTPEVISYINAVAGTSEPGSPAWGSELVPDSVSREFAEMLMPATIIGRLSLSPAPFLARIVVQTGGSTVEWVGETGAKPVSNLDFTSFTLPHHKIAGIVVVSDELVRLSQPNAEALVRQDMTRQVVKFMDQQFIDKAVTIGVDNPASITNGVSAISASGTDIEALTADVNAALATFDVDDLGTINLAIVTGTSVARGISMMRDSFSSLAFPTMTPNGGTLFGYPVIVSNSTPSGDLVFVKQDEVLLADDGRVTLDASNQATLDMGDGNGTTFNLWQRNCTGVRAERWITYLKRRANAVALITGAAYGPAVGSP